MKQLPRPVRKPAVLSELLHHHLNAYTVAASAAGVGMLALSTASQAKIIYTPAHQVIRQNGTYPLDLNHDGTVDFLIHELTRGNIELRAQGAYGNSVEFSGIYPAALKRGAWIGPSQRFFYGGYRGELMLAVTYFTYGTMTVKGAWYNVRRRYLGLKFQIGGEAHYGWARLNVSYDHGAITATLTGYAYETTANERLDAGDRGSTTGQGISQPPDEAKWDLRPGLGQLALGFQGRSQGRKP